MHKKLVTLLSILFVALTTFAYSALSTSLAITSEVTFRAIADIRVNGIAINSASGGAVIQYESKYSRDSISSGFTLPNANSSISYTVHIDNTGDVDYTIYDVLMTSSSDPGLQIDLGSYNLKDIIPAKSSLDLIVTYTTTNPSDNVINVTNNFDFRRVFRISYNTGTSQTIPTQIKYERENLTLTSTVPTKNGYTFYRWNTKQDGTGVNYNSGATYTVDEDKILYATWNITNYNITYVLNGGTNGNNPSTYTVETNNITLADATKDGYTFKGWTGNGTTTPTKNLVLPKGSYGDKEFTANFEDETDPVITVKNQDGSVDYLQTAHTVNAAFGSNQSNLRVWINATDVGSGIASIEYAYTNSSTAPSSGWTTTTNGELSVNKTPGNYYLHVKATDSEGNETVVTTKLITARLRVAYYDDYSKSTTISANQYYVDSALTSRTPAAVTGYTFDGWYSDQALTTKVVNANTSYTPTNSIQLYGKWTINNYSITYTLNGGSVSGTNPTTYNVNTNTFTLINPTKNGYTFKGWSGTGLTGDENQTVTITKGSTGNRSYTANWTLNSYVITYNLNGGQIGTECATEGGTCSFSGTKEVCFGAEGTYTCKQATSSIACGTAGFDGTDPTPGKRKHCYIAGTNPVSYSVESPTFTLNNPVKQGYTFKGWSGTDLTGDENTTVTVPTGSTGVRTYTANYTAKTYTVSFNPMGGKYNNTTGLSTKTMTYGTTNNNDVGPATREGYTFKGWYTGATTGAQVFDATGKNIYYPTFWTAVYPNGTWRFAGDTTFYAQWTANQYTVTANAEGGSIPSTTGWTGTGNTSTKPVTYGSAYGTLPTPTRTGYTFKGWTTENLINIPDKNITFTNAHYSEEPSNPRYVLEPNTTYTLSFDYVVNSATQNIFTSVGYGANNFQVDIKSSPGYSGTGTNVLTFTTPSTFNYSPANVWFRFVRMGTKGDANVDISNIRLVKGSTPTDNITSETIVGIADDHDIYAKWADESAPTNANITSTNSVASSQTATLTCSDTVGVTSYYWGTTAPTDSSTYTDITSTTSMSVNKTVSDGGTYYLACKDAAGNKSTTVSKVFYKTTFNMTNGTVSPASVVTMAGNSFNLPTPTPTSGYTAKGLWYTNSQMTIDGRAYGASYTPASSIEMYSSATLDTFTVEVVVNNGTVSPVSKVVTRNDTTTFTVGANTGYNNPTVSCTNSQTATISGTTLTTGAITSNTVCTVTYVAKTYTLTIDPNGGTYNSTTSTSSKTMTYDASTNNDIGVPTRSGYTFAGWYTQANGGVQIYDENGRNTNASGYWSAAYSTGVWKHDGAVTVYAKWTKPVSELTKSLSPTTYVYDGSSKSPTPTVKDGTTTLTRGTHYTITYGDANVGEKTATITGAGVYNSTTKAYYTGTTTLTYYINNAGLTFDKGTCTATTGTTTLYTKTGVNVVYTTIRGTTTGTIPTASKIGYTFDGWYTTASGTGSKVLNANGTFTGTAVSGYTSTNAWATVEDKTLYARCTPATYIVTANANGGSIPSTTGWTGTGATSTKQVTYNSAYGTLPTPTKTGYTFQGWNGKNVFKETDLVASDKWQANQNVTVTKTSDSVQVIYNQTNSTPGYIYRYANDFLEVGKTYTVSALVRALNKDNQVLRVAVYSGSPTISTSSLSTGDYQLLQGTFTFTSAANNYILIYGLNMTLNTGFEIKYLQIEEGTTATTYEPYYIDSSTIVTTAGDHEINAVWSINDPATPTITGGTTKIYGSSATTLTCSSSTSYASGATKYYSFGYATSDGGTPGNWSTPTTANTLSVASDYVGQRWYSCRVYATDGTQTSGTVTSAISADTEMTVNNATLTFNKGTCDSTTGTTTLYTKTGVNVVYTTIRGTTTGTIPTASKTGYSFDGWYTSASGTGSKVLNSDNSFTGTAVSGYTTTNAWATVANQTLYARCSANSYTVTADANGGSIPATTGWTGTGASATKSVTYDAAYGTLPTPTKAGFTFEGWTYGIDFSSSITWNSWVAPMITTSSQMSRLKPSTTYKVEYDVTLNEAIPSGYAASQTTQWGNLGIRTGTSSYTYTVTGVNKLYAAAGSNYTVGTKYHISDTITTPSDLSTAVMVFYTARSTQTGGSTGYVINGTFSNIVFYENTDTYGYVDSSTIVKVADDHTIDARWSINNPATPTISGGATKVYGSNATTLTCSENTTYASGATKYYSFGYASSDGGNPSSWTDFSTNNTLSVASNYVGQRWYSCRVRVVDDVSGVSASVTSSPTADQEVTVNNATLTFDKGTCASTSGTTTLYTKQGANVVYTTIRGTTTGTIPTASKTGYNFLGWYTTSSGTGSKVLNANGTFTGTAVSGYTTVSAWDTIANQTLYARCSEKTYTLTINPNGGTYNSTTSNSSKTMTYNATTNNDIGIPTRDGYTFDGWYLAANNKTSKMYDNTGKNVLLSGYWDAAYSTGKWVHDGDATIYAHWSKPVSSLTKSISPTNYIYDGNAKSPTPTVKDGSTSLTNGTEYTIAYGDASVGDKTATITGANVYNSTTKAYYTGTTTVTYYINNATLTFDATTNGGTLNGTSPMYARKGTTGVYTGVRNSTAGTIPTASKTGWTFTGWYDGNTKVINADGTIVASVANWTDSSKNWLITTVKTLTAKYEPVAPSSVTISGGATKVYNSTATTLTCTAAGNYASGTTKYYSFGYATSDGGTPSNWTTYSSTNTLTVANNAYVGQRWYSCKAYASDGSQSTAEVVSPTTGDQEVTINNAKLVFDATTNGGTISGTTPLYARYGASGVYTGIRNETAGTIPTATKTGWSFSGWYSGNTKVINNDGTVVASVSNWTDSSSKWLITADQTLTAKYTINNPATPTITGGATRIYGASATTLTCSTTSTYATGTKKYYSFGYATSDGGTPSNWTTYSETNTLSVATDYVGQRWYSCKVKASDGTSTSSEVASATSADQEVTTNNAKITYNANNCGTISGTSPAYVKKGTTGVYTTIRGTTAGTVATVSKAGYTFNGWYDGNTKVINADGTIVASVSNWTDSSKNWLITADKTLTASCTAKTYTLTIDPNGGSYNSSTSISSKTMTYGSTNNNDIGTPTRDGYTFAGWYTAANGGTQIYDASGHNTNASSYWTAAYSTGTWKYDGAVTVYAKWTKPVSSLTNSVSPTTYIYDGSAKSPTPTVKDGNTTLTSGTHYTVSYANNTNVGTATATITGAEVYNTTTKAYYTGTATVNYYINNATLTFNVGSCTSVSGTSTLYTKTGATAVYTAIRGTTAGTIPTASKTGYTFQGWYTAATSGTKVLNANGTFTSSAVSGYTTASAWATVEDKTLYAVCTPTSYTVTANASGGSIASTSGWTGTGATSTKSVTYDSAYGTLPTVNKNGYTFAGWSLVPEGYTPVEYIQSSGTQYIDTGYYWTHENIEIYFDGTVLSNPSSQSLFGNEEYILETGNSRNFAGIPHGSGGTIYSIFLGDSGQGNIATGGLGERFTLDIKTTVDRHLYVYTNGTETFNKTYNGSVLTHDTAYIVSSSSSNVGNIFLFANHNTGRGSNNGAIQNISSMRAYAFKLYDNNVLVRDFVPCVQISTGKAGLYDRVNGVFYGNAATTGDDFTVPETAYYITSETIVKTASNHNIYAHWSIVPPATPTITGGATKVYGSSATQLTCSTTSTYATGTNKYYSFGYATSDGGTPANWTTATTTNTLSVATDYVGQRWYSCRVYASDGTATSGTVTSATSADQEVTVNNATLTFNTNGGTTDNSNLYVRKGTTGVYTGIRNETAGTIPIPTRNGYTFNGWYTAASAGTKVINADGTVIASISGWTDSSKKWLLTANNVLYAQWTEKTYTLTINPNGGSLDGSTSTVVRNLKYSDVSDITTPTRTGYTFAGWAELEAAKKQADTLAGISKYANIGGSAVTITTGAKSSDNPLSGTANEVKIVNDGSTATAPGLGGFYRATTAVASTSYIHVFVAKVDAGKYLHIQHNSMGTGYTESWLTSNEGTGEWQTYAYQINTGTGNLSTFGHVNVSASKTKRTSETGTFTLNLGFTNIYDVTANSAGIGQYDGTGVLTAQWTANQYSVAFNANGGSGGQSSNVTATYGSAMPAISTTAPTKAGHTFLGWYDSASGGTQYYTAAGASAKNYDKTSGTTLYAHWSANPYTVSFNANGGSGGQSADVTATYGSAMPAISTTAPTRLNYTFMGWYDNSNYAASGAKQYYTAAGASARSYDKASATILYAGWKINNPATPTITGGATKVYGSSAATLTCSTTSTYPTGTNLYYSFGYATSDGGTPSNWTTASTTNTLSVATNYVGQRWYSCKVYASDGTATSDTIASAVSADQEVTVNNAKITYNANSCGTITGTSPAYVKSGMTGVYTTIRGTTAGTVAKVTANTGYTFNGWYSGSTKVINADGTIVASVANWTDSSKNWLITEDKTLTASCTANTYAITYNYNTTNYQATNTNYIDTGYTIDWDRNFGLNSTFNLPALSVRYLFFGNFNTTNELNIELSNANRLRVYSGGDKGYSTATVAANTDVQLDFNYTASNKSFTATTTGTNSNTSANGTNDKSGLSGTTLRIGTDSRVGNTFSPYTLKAASITDYYQYGGKLTKLPASPTKVGYTFVGWFDAETGGNQVTTNTNVPASNKTYYARWSKAVSNLTTSISPTSYIYNGSAKSPTPTVKDGNTTLTSGTDYTISYANNTNVGTATATITGSNTYNSTTKTYYTGSTAINYYINNATLTFDKGTCDSVSGTSTLYTRTGATAVYTGIRETTTTGTIPTATKTGYTFQGWYTATNGTKVLNANGSFTSSAVSGYTTASAWATVEDKTLYAVCTANTYTVAYNGNGHSSGSTASSSHTYDVEKALTLNGYAKTGYTFAGWSTSSSDKNLVYDNSEYHQDATSISNNYLELKQYSVAGPFAEGEVYQLDYDAKGTGTCASYFYGGTNYLRVASVTNSDGYSGTGGDGYNPVTLTSSYKHYSVRFTLGSTGDGTVQKILLIRAIKGNDCYAKNIRFYKVSSSSVAYTDGQTVKNLTTTNNGTVNLYAVWKINDPATPTITGGATKIYGASATQLTCSTTSTYATGTNKYYSFGYATSDGGTPANWTTPTTTNTLNVATDYVGQRWYSCRVYASDGTITSATATSATSADQEVTVNNAKITYSANNCGTISGTSPAYVKKGTSGVYTTIRGTTAGTVATVSKTGYTFNGWYSGSTKIINADGTIVASVSNWTDASKNWLITEDKTLTASCTAKTYTLTIDPNGGSYNSSTSTSSKTMTYASTNNNDIGTPTRDGYTFAGWYTAQNGGTQVYDASGHNTNASSYWTAAYNTGTWKYDGAVTVYAKWTKAVSSLNTTLNKDAFVYTGSAQGPTVTVKDGNTTLTSGTHYTVSGNSNTNVGEYTVTITGSGTYNTTTKAYYTGTTTKTYYINNAKLTFNVGTCTTGSGTLYTKTGVTGVYTTIRGTTAGTIPTGSKTGYQFDGWYTASSGGSQVLTSANAFTGTAVSGYTTASAWATVEDKTLYARCNTAKTYTLTIDPNGGSYNSSTSTSTKTMTYASTNNNDIGTPTRDGYTFAGWYTAQNGGTQVYDTSGHNTNASSYWTAAYNTGTWKYDGAVTVYAKWTKAVSALTNSVSPTSYVYNGSAKSPAATVKDGNTTLTSGTHYTVSYANNTNVGTATATITGAEVYNTTTKAYYTGTTTVNYYINNATLTFNAGTCTSVSGTTPLYTRTGATAVYTGIRETTTTGTIPTASKTGYTFAGWYTASSGGTKVLNANGTFTSSAVSGYTTASAWATVEDKMLYARCDTAKTYTLTIDPNGGTYSSSTSTSTKTMTYASTNNNDIGTPTRDGYTFAGWYTAQNGGTQVYDASGHNTNASSYWTAAYNTGTWKYDGAVTVYAKWTKAVSNLTITLNQTDFVYNGSAQGPTVTVKDGDTTLTSGTDYSISGASSTNVGSYNATITGSSVYNTTTKAYYTGSTTKAYYINNATLTFDATTNGGSISGTTPLYARKGQTGVFTQIRNSTAGTMPTATKTGWTFNGWYTASSNGTKIVNSDGTIVASVSNWTDSSRKWLITANQTLYAQYTIQSHAVHYDCTTNGGTGSIADKTVNYGTAVDLTPTCTKDGWTFVGWNTSSSATSQVSPAPTMGTIDINLYAIYRKESITLNATLNANGATLNPASPLTRSCTLAAVYNNATQDTSCTVDMPTVSRTSYTLVGWNTTSGATTNNSSYNTSTKKLTLTASNTGNTWYVITRANNQLTATFANNNGATVASTSATCYLYNQATSCTVDAPTVTPQSGFSKIGFNTDATATTNNSNYNTTTNKLTISANGTWYPITKSTTQYTGTFTIQDSNAATQSGGTTSCYRYNGNANCNIVAPTLSAKTNYEALGWNSSSTATSATIASGDSISINGNKTYYSITRATTAISATFNKNTSYAHVSRQWVGGAPYTSNVTRQCYKYNGATSCDITSPTIEASTGYKSVGYNTTASATTSTWNQDTSKTLSSNVTYYAITTPKTYYVKYNANCPTSSSGTMADSTFLYGGSYNLRTNAYSCTGHIFDKWTRNQDGTGTSYTDGQVVSNLTSTDGATVNLYAQWKEVWAENLSFDNTTARTKDSTITCIESQCMIDTLWERFNQIYHR